MFDREHSCIYYARGSTFDVRAIYSQVRLRENNNM